MKKVINDPQEIKYLVGNVLGGIISRLKEAAEQPATTPPPPAQQTQEPSTVSVSKVANGQAGVSDDVDELQKGNVTIEMIVEKLNSIRSGRSFKDQNIMSQMSTYFNDLNDNEKLALYAFLKGISQIVTGEVSGEQAVDPQKTHPELEVTAKNDQKVHKIKPNIIKKKSSAPAQPTAKPAENTASPAPIVPKSR